MADTWGWDLGGAHLKGACWRGGRLVDVAQWPCPVWQGLPTLQAALQQALARWPAAHGGRHALTMTAEMTDLFSDRADGVRQLSRLMQDTLGGDLAVYAGPADAAGPARWARAADAGDQWARIASANWLATAQHAAAVLGDGLLIDIGSTTTDLIRLRGGQPDTASLSDRDRLAAGELVYQGVVRTPVCALAQHVRLQGRRLSVMNEWFATSADLYRVTGELDEAHDQQPAADNGAKDRAGSLARLARLVGCDRRDASDADWLALAQQWRSAQLGWLAEWLHQVQAAPPQIGRAHV